MGIKHILGLLLSKTIGLTAIHHSFLSCNNAPLGVILEPYHVQKQNFAFASLPHSYQLGSGEAEIRSAERINDGHWHKITAVRYFFFLYLHLFT